MPAPFHWIKLRMVCYATEREGLLREVMEALVPGVELAVSRSQGHHGNPLTVIEASLGKKREFKDFFRALGPEVAGLLLEELDRRVEEDCTLYFRLDKQAAVLGELRIASHGDVISVVAKVVSHPARKETAVTNLDAFLRGCLADHN